MRCKLAISTPRQEDLAARAFRDGKRRADLDDGAELVRGLHGIDTQPPVLVTNVELGAFAGGPRESFEGRVSEIAQWEVAHRMFRQAEEARSQRSTHGRRPASAGRGPRALGSSDAPWDASCRWPRRCRCRSCRRVRRRESTSSARSRVPTAVVGGRRSASSAALGRPLATRVRSFTSMSNRMSSSVGTCYRPSTVFQYSELCSR